MSGYDADVYVIHFCSDEVVLSEQYRISKSYSNKIVSDMIYDILKNHLKVPDNKLNVRNIEKSKGLYNFVVPNFKPFEGKYEMILGLCIKDKNKITKMIDKIEKMIKARGPIVYLKGFPGIGKSAVVKEIAKRKKERFFGDSARFWRQNKYLDPKFIENSNLIKKKP